MTRRRRFLVLSIAAVVVLAVLAVAGWSLLRPSSVTRENYDAIAIGMPREDHPELLERALAIERNAQAKLKSVKGLGRS
jgi:HAMP domain-containing protein